jgi:hypothetical protein
MPGITTSVAEVTHVSRHGFWVLLGAEELFLPFEQFPWFSQEAKYTLYETGTIRGAVYSGCPIERIEQRTSELERWVGN